MPIKPAKIDVITIGRSSVDLYGAQVGGRLEDMVSFNKYIGGSPTNIAVAARRLGVKTALLTAVGEDPVGDFILNFLDQEEIATDFIPDLENHIKWIELIDTIVPKFDIVFTNDELTQHLYSKRNVQVLSIPFTKRDVLSGTNIRDLITSDQKWESLVPEGTKNFLSSISAKERLKNL